MRISAFIAFEFEYARDCVFVCVCLCTPGVLAWGQMLCLTDKASKLLKATLWVGLLYHRGNPRTFPRFFFATSFGLSSWHWRDCLPHPPNSHTHTHTETVISSLFSIKTPQYENQETVCPILRREKERESFLKYSLTTQHDTERMRALSQFKSSAFRLFLLHFNSTETSRHFRRISLWAKARVSSHLFIVNFCFKWAC